MHKPTGIAWGMVVCVHGVCAGTLTAGDAVLFIQLMAQLYAPLKFIASYYRQVVLGVLSRNRRC